MSLLTELWDFFAVRFFKDASPTGFEELNLCPSVAKLGVLVVQFPWGVHPIVRRAQKRESVHGKIMNTPELSTDYPVPGAQLAEVARTHGMGRQRSGCRARRGQPMVQIAN
jgi:hypothetical protein